MGIREGYKKFFTLERDTKYIVTKTGIDHKPLPNDHKSPANDHKPPGNNDKPPAKDHKLPQKNTNHQQTTTNHQQTTTIKVKPNKSFPNSNYLVFS